MSYGGRRADGSSDDEPAASSAAEGATYGTCRPLYSQAAFEKRYVEEARPQSKYSGVLGRWKRLCRSCPCCSKEDVARFFLRRFPIIDTLRTYNLKRDLPGDLIAGVTVGITNVQQGMAYGLLATLTPVYGLYVSFYPAIVYFFLATSRHNSIGVFAVISMMVGSTVDSCMPQYVPFNGGETPAAAAATTTQQGVEQTTMAAASAFNASLADDELRYRAGVAAAIGFFTGIFQIGMGMLGLGFVTIYMADPIISGFTTAVAMHVLTSQIPSLFGVQSSQFTGPLALIYSYIDFFGRIKSTNVATLVTSVISLVVLMAVKMGINDRFKSKLRVPVPIELLLVIGATVVSYFANLQDAYDIDVVGDIPRGLRAPAVPPMGNAVRLLASSFAIAIVCFAVSVSMAQVFAKKHNYEIDANQEMLAYGVTNWTCSFFGCFPACASLSRSSIQESVGGRTPVTDIVSSLLVLVVLLALGPYMQPLPKSVLSCIVVAGLVSIFVQVAVLKTLWRVSKYDFCMWVVTFLAVVVLNVDSGLAVGVAFGVLSTMFRSQRAHVCILGRICHTDIYRNLSKYKAAQEVDGVKIFRMDAPLYYVNAEYFRQNLYKLTGANPRELKRQREEWKAELEAKKRSAAKAATRAAIAGRKKGNGGAAAASAILQRISSGREDTDAERGGAPCSSEDHIVPTPAEVSGVPRFNIHHIVIDCNPMNYIDSSGVKMLMMVHSEYMEADVDVLFAGCRGAVRTMLKRSGFYEEVSPTSLYITIHDAVMAATASDESAHDQLQADVVVTDEEVDLEGVED